MGKDEQHMLFALSAPMEILNQGCKPSHDSPAMYTGIKKFDLSSSWGIDNREDLLKTIYQMTDMPQILLKCIWHGFAYHLRNGGS